VSSGTTFEARRERLIDLARSTPWFMGVLAAARTLALPDWCIGAGAVRNLVWDALHAHPAPTALADIDLAYFDPNDLSIDRDRSLAATMTVTDPRFDWDVTNQAAVHLWFDSHFGHAVEPLRSIDEAVASWPEFATAVAMRLSRDDAIEVIAPHGLDDLFEMIVRRNPTRVGVETCRRRVREKRYEERWPRVRIVPA
jgi:uncharacterized protein